jgi:7-cyano-7-deazaguanine synthase
MKAVVIHSGGMDSSVCLKLAINEFGADQVHSISFDYNQRHRSELISAEKINRDWGVKHIIINIDYLSRMTTNALVTKDMHIKTNLETKKDEAPNVLVVGRNGLMVRIASIFAHNLGAEFVYTGILGLDNTSNFRDCSREYMDKMQELMRIDTGNPAFEIRTPLVEMDKIESMELALKLGILEYLLEETITCYRGIPKEGCGVCPSCDFRNQAIKKILQDRPGLTFSFKDKI